MVVAVDDLAERGVGVVIQLFVADADAVVVGQSGGAVFEQQLEDVVAVFAEPGDGPEHADFRHGGRQPMQDAECDGRLAGVALGRRDVDARAGHA